MNWSIKKKNYKIPEAQIWWDSFIYFWKAKIGTEFTSNINGKIKTDSLTLDLFLRVEHGNSGKWNLVSSKVREVDRKVLNNRPNYKTMPKPNLNEMGNNIKEKGNNY